MPSMNNVIVIDDSTDSSYGDGASSYSASDDSSSSGVVLRRAAPQEPEVISIADSNASESMSSPPYEESSASASSASASSASTPSASASSEGNKPSTSSSAYCSTGSSTGRGKARRGRDEDTEGRKGVRGKSGSNTNGASRTRRGQETFSRERVRTRQSSSRNEQHQRGPASRRSRTRSRSSSSSGTNDVDDSFSESAAYSNSHSSTTHSDRQRRGVREDRNDKKRKLIAEDNSSRNNKRKSRIPLKRKTSTPQKNTKEAKLEERELAWKNEVEDAVQSVRQERMTRIQERLRKSLHTKNILLQKQQLLNNASHRYPLLDSVSNKPLGLPIRGAGSLPIPRDTTTTIFLKNHFQPNCSSNDNSNEEDNEEKEDENLSDTNGAKEAVVTREKVKSEEQKITENNTKQRNRFESLPRKFKAPERIGVGYEERDADEEIDEVLAAVSHLRHDRQELHEYVAWLLYFDVERVNLRYDAQTEDVINKEGKQGRSEYEEVMSSFRDLFCRRCFTYDCNIHGLADSFCPSLQADLAIQKELKGRWNPTPTTASSAGQLLPNSVGSALVCSPTATAPQADSSRSPEVELSTAQTALCKRLHQIFRGDLQSVSTASGISKESISKLQLGDVQTLELKSFDDNKSSKQRSNFYNQTWLKRIVGAEMHPFFFPCHHTGRCSEETCTCIKYGFFCTKHCVWGSRGRNYFRGCNCTGKCTFKSCPCFASNRECDPDLCKTCGACTDPPNKPATKQRCRNDNIGMRRHSHLLVAKSDVAGWGLFTKYPLAKGDYLHEYLGEVISQDEAERRGKGYDEQNQTYLFDLSTDYAVDAWHKGNKTRFINHSNTPNVMPKLCVVNGDYRIGFFAKVNIPAQSELFFDYGKMFFSSKENFMKKTAENGTEEADKTKEQKSDGGKP